MVGVRTRCELRTVRTLVRTLTLAKHRARASRIAFWPGRTRRNGSWPSRARNEEGHRSLRGLYALNARKISRNTSEKTSGCCTPKSDRNPHRHAGFPTTSRLFATTPNVSGNCRLPQFSFPSAGARRPIPVPSASDAMRLSGHRQSGSRCPSTDIVVLASRRGVAVLLPATEPTAWSPASGRWQQGREESGRPVAQLPGFPMACV